MHPVTRALHTRIDNTVTSPAVTPIYQNSAFTSDSPYFYTRKDNPNIAELEAVLCALENARYAVAVSSGMASIYMTLDLLRAGDTLVVNQDLYGCSFRLFQRLSERRGFSVKVLDLSLEKGVSEIPEGTKMVFFETPTNPFLKTVHIRKVSSRVKAMRSDALVVVDNTWATPLFQHPLEHGADISLHSGTKYFSGHSDVMGGVLLTNSAELAEELRQTRFYGGSVLDPFAACLLRRSLQTLDIRLEKHRQVTLEMRDFLATLPQVAKVYYPEVDGTQLMGYGGILFFELREDLTPRYRSFAQRLQLFDTGTGMACVSSMVAQPYSGSHASMTAEEKRDMGLQENLVRLCFGLEHPDDLKADILAAFASVDDPARQEGSAIATQPAEG
jgi:cystathionine gamma-lyase/cystathionine gamma-lyase/homocysteine desulfhydrase